MDTEVVQRELQELPGIGPKVADCIALYSLECVNLIPIDTHIFQIAKKYYLPKSIKADNLSRGLYSQITEVLQKQFGEYSGWA